MVLPAVTGNVFRHLREIVAPQTDSDYTYISMGDRNRFGLLSCTAEIVPRPAVSGECRINLLLGVGIGPDMLRHALYTERRER